MISNPNYSIIIPVYNEATYIGNFIDEIRKKISGNYEIIVVDSGSIDNSFLACKNKKVDKIIKLNTYIPKIDSVFIGSLFSDSNIIITIDGDGYYDPKFISNLLIPINSNTADAVIGSRITIPKDINKFGYIIYRIFNELFKILFSKYLIDPLSSFRSFKKNLISSEINSIKSTIDYNKLEKIVLNDKVIYDIKIIQDHKYKRTIHKIDDVILNYDFITKNYKIKEIPIKARLRESYGYSTKISFFRYYSIIIKNLIEVISKYVF